MAGHTASASRPEAANSLERLAGVPVRQFRPLGGEHGVRHYRARLADGRELFVKAATDDGGQGKARDGAAGLDAEANGLRWLRAAGAVCVPEIFFISNGLLALQWLDSASADRAAAEQFGRDLAAMHAAGSDHFGAPWRGFIASLPLPNVEADSWPAWYTQRRLLPYCKLARNSGTLSQADVSLIESVAERIDDLAGPAEPPSRIHGDCWSGNVMWSGGRGWLIDPAAHGGHRESDLAMLELFGAPYLDRIGSAYAEVAPLAAGWQARVPLHQLHPLLVHLCLFGAGYRESALAAAHAALRA